MTVSIHLPTRTRAHRFAIAIYLGMTAALVVPANLVARGLGGNAAHVDQSPVVAQIALYTQAVIPAVAALAAWGVLRHRPTWGFRRTPWARLGAAWFIAVLGVALGASLAWLTGSVDVDPAGLSTAFGGLPAPVAVMIGLLPGVVPWLLLAVGEELGWNSFLTPQLALAWGADRTAIVVGLLWASFHLPLMALVPGAVSDGVPIIWTAGWFTVECVALAFPLVWTRLHTQSIWPALVLHGTVNAALYLVVDPATRRLTHSGWFVGEGGVCTTVGIVGAVIITVPLWRRGRLTTQGDEAARATSGQPPSGTTT